MKSIRYIIAMATLFIASVPKYCFITKSMIVFKYLYTIKKNRYNNLYHNLLISIM